MFNVCASHFDASGNADSFISRSNYLFFMILLITLTSLFIGGLGKFVTSLPEESINLPNRSYWLSPERKVESLKYISNWLQLFSAGIAVFLCYVHWLVVQANSTESKQLESTHLYIGLGVMLVALIVGIISMISRFRIDPD